VLMKTSSVKRTFTLIELLLEVLQRQTKQVACRESVCLFADALEVAPAL
jgi:hypothetical protein